MVIQKLRVFWRFLTLLGCAAILFFSTTVSAQQWEFQPVISVSAEYDSNPRLLEGDLPVDEISGAAVDLRGRIARMGPTSYFRIQPRIRSTRYPDNKSEESDDYFLDILARRKTQTTNYGISAQASREAVLTAELGDPNFDDPDIADPVSDDSGLVTFANGRDKVFISPFAGFQLTERTDLRLRASYIDADYERDVNGNVDYKTLSSALDIGFDVGERSSIGITVFARKYETKNFFNESNVIGAGLTFEREFSRTIRGSISVGPSEIEREFNGENDQRQKTTSRSAVYRANLTKAGEISRIVADIQQSVDPSGTGRLRVRRQLRLRYIRSLSPTLNMTLETRIQKLDAAIEGQGSNDRDFARIGAKLEKRLSRTWSINGSYTWTQQDFSDNPGDAISNAFSLGLRYEPRRGE